jgi:hypothetical protein
MGIKLRKKYGISKSDSLYERGIDLKQLNIASLFFLRAAHSCSLPFAMIKKSNIYVYASVYLVDELRANP